MNPICMSKHPSRNNVWCSRVPDHDGPHWASDGCTWGASPAEPRTGEEDWQARAVKAEQPRPLTPTDEMVERGMAHIEEKPWTVRSLLTAALTEPPPRPFWGADIEAVIRGHDGGALDPTAQATIADRVAEFMAQQENRAAGTDR